MKINIDIEFCNNCLTPIVLLSQYQSSNLSIFSSMYQSRYNSLCIHVSILIQPFVFSSMYQSRYNFLYSQACINPDTTLCILKHILIQIKISQTLWTLTRANTSELNKTVFIFNWLYFGIMYRSRLNWPIIQSGDYNWMYIYYRFRFPRYIDYYYIYYIHPKVMN